MAAYSKKELADLKKLVVRLPQDTSWSRLVDTINARDRTITRLKKRLAAAKGLVKIIP